MRPDHTATDFAAPGASLPVASANPGDDETHPQRDPLTRMTFCFAWLFGLDPFLAGGVTPQPGVESDSRL